MSDDSQSIREIRINPIVPSESVLVSTARGLRPRKEETPVEQDAREHVEKCPFCTGNEEMTPATIAAWPTPTDWEVRVVENLFPVLSPQQSGNAINFGLQKVIDGYGRHEVVIDHRNHGIRVSEMDVDHISGMFSMFRDRMQEIYASDERIKYVLVFKNFGAAAGASIAHSHSQIVAMPVVPENVVNELSSTRQYYQKHHQNIFHTLIDEALTFEATIYDRDSGEVRRKINVGQYIIERGEYFIAVKPFASRFEWEVQILPLFDQADFIDIKDEHLNDFATVLKHTMQRLNHVLGGVQYNFFLHSLPHSAEWQDCVDSYVWHLEICPRTSIPTGFELGSGLFVSTVSPEDAAEQLREVKL